MSFKTDASTAAHVQAGIPEADLDAKLPVSAHQTHTCSHCGTQVDKPRNEKVQVMSGITCDI